MSSLSLRWPRASALTLKILGRPSLLAQFSILSLALFIVIGVLMGYGLTTFFREQALEQQEVVVSSLMGPIVRMRIDQKILTEAAYPPPAGASEAEKSKYAYTRIENALSNVSGAGLVRIKIWNRNGMVVYSDDGKQVGQHFPISDELQHALDGYPSANLSSLDKVENVDEKAFGQLLEVYTPLQLPGQHDIAGAIEGYYEVQDLKDRLDRTSAFLWASIGAGFLFLYLSLFTIVRNASQRILRQSSENLVLLNDTERKAARLEMLNDVARAINRSSLDLADVFDTALRGIARIVPQSAVSVTLFDETTGTPVHTVSSPATAPSETNQEEIAAEKALVEQNSIFTSRDTRLGALPVLQSLARRHVLSLLIIPIRLGERYLGMLRVENDTPDAFDDDDAALLKGVADQLAVAIENTRLIRETAETTALRETNRLKDEFVSMVSHELRTPLASIKGYSRTLLASDGQWDEQTRQEFTRIISDESDKLQDLVENLLEMTRIEAGRLPIAVEPILLRRFCWDVVDRVAKQHPEMHFECELQDSLIVVEADPRRVEQVLVNLLQNAAQYSGAERVAVNATYSETDRQVTVHVSDNGIGIPPEHLPHLFDKFYRAMQPQGDSGTGTGLGLAIARALVEAQGGQIWVESTLHKGTTFYFTLPAYKLEGREMPG